MQFRGVPGLFDFEIGHGGGRMVDGKWEKCKGTEVTVRADHIIEEFVKGLGDGTTKPMPTTGYLWYPLTPSPLLVYNVGNGELPMPDFDGYQLDQVNKMLVIPAEMPGQSDAVNLSFLRFKGISSPEGVTFGIKTVMSPSMMDSLTVRIGKACRQLCRDYIVPTSRRLMIVTEGKE
jgi:hypothetical protein